MLVQLSLAVACIVLASGLYLMVKTFLTRRSRESQGG
jgi:hypothetical protein